MEEHYKITVIVKLSKYTHTIPMGCSFTVHNDEYYKKNEMHNLSRYSIHSVYDGRETITSSTKTKILYFFAVKYRSFFFQIILY